MKKAIKLPRNKAMMITLTVVMLAAALLAVWFFASPVLEQQRRAEHQAALLESITTGDGTITVNDRYAAEEVDFYDDGPQAPAVEMIAFLPEIPLTVEAAEEQPQESGGNVITGIGVLTIERIDAVLPVAEGVSSAQLKVALGHVPQTAAIGDTGNAVIAGHRSYEYGQFLNRLGEVELNDIILYQPKDGEEMRFIVDEILEIVPGDQVAFEQPEDNAQITLYTCTPIRTATHRLLVRASRII
ncbi:class D sortase [Eubacteriales bacterium OttesenSCG-928-N13]|nr:class D sortase [Eubacteriales bacterium OttesenSCG-928-N13]